MNNFRAQSVISGDTTAANFFWIPFSIKMWMQDDEALESFARLAELSASWTSRVPLSSRTSQVWFAWTFLTQNLISIRRKVHDNSNFESRFYAFFTPRCNIRETICRDFACSHPHWTCSIKQSSIRMICPNCSARRASEEGHTLSLEG